MKIALSGNKGHLIFTEDVFNEHGVATSSKIGAKRIDPAQSEKALKWAQTQKWEFSGEPVNGFYEMSLVETPAAEAETGVASNEIAK